MAVGLGSSMLIGSGLNAAADIYNTERNIKFQREENQKARDWQERMSNTAYQRSVVDLEKAGLNKLLAYGATPPNITASNSGAQASGSRSADFTGYSKGVEADRRLSLENKKLELQQDILNAKQANLEVKRQFHENKYLKTIMRKD